MKIASGVAVFITGVGLALIGLVGNSTETLYEDITEETILADLAGCRTLLSPGDLFQIDDGCESAVGDWLEPDVASSRMD